MKHWCKKICLESGCSSCIRSYTVYVDSVTIVLFCSYVPDQDSSRALGVPQERKTQFVPATKAGVT